MSEGGGGCRGLAAEVVAAVQWWCGRLCVRDVRMARGLGRGDRCDDNEGGVMVGCGGEAAGRGGGAWRRVTRGIE
ncbi:hypothetical protein Tco_0555731 [Tanacetum coccineum]